MEKIHFDGGGHDEDTGATITRKTFAFRDLKILEAGKRLFFSCLLCQ